MAIEDCLAFTQEIQRGFDKPNVDDINVKNILGNFFRARILRSSVVSGMAGIFKLFTYLAEKIFTYPRYNNLYFNL